MGRPEKPPPQPATACMPSLPPDPILKPAVKQWRGLATRYDKTRESYQAAVTIASTLLWI